MEQRVKEVNPKVNTCVIQFDFEGVTNMAAYEKLKDDVEQRNIDVGLLVVNAGLVLTNYLEKLDPKAV